MRPLNGTDAVDLHEADTLHQARDIRPPERRGAEVGQTMQPEKKPPRIGV